MSKKSATIIEQRLASHAEGVRHLVCSLPESCVDEIRGRLERELSLDGEYASSTPRFCGTMNLPRLVKLAVGVAAVLAMLAFGTLWLLRNTRPMTMACDVASSDLPDESGSEHHAQNTLSAGQAIETAVVISTPAPVEPVAESLTVLQAEFERLKASDAGVGNAFLIRLVNHIVSVRDKDSKEYLGLCMLLVETYEQMGERDRALVAYGRYLDVVERRDGREKAALLAWYRTDELFRVRGERSEALGYSDLILARYPDTPLAREARLMPARLFELENMWQDAADAYGRVVQEEEGNPAARRAMVKQSVMLANSGNHAAAIRVLETALAGAESMREKSDIHFQLGWRYYYRGLAYHQAAKREFLKAIEHDPACQYDAERMLARIQTAAREGVADILN